MNIQGIITGENNKRKINFLSEKCIDENIKLVIITETHLTNEILDTEVTLTDFNVYRADRKERERGGVAIYLHNSLETNETQIQRYSNSVCELIMLYENHMKTHIICIYRPPDTKSGEFLEVLEEVENYVKTINTDHNVILIGDFNFRFLRWSKTNDQIIHNIKSGGTKDEQLQANALIDLTDKYYLNQCICEPTRINNVLDLIFINDTDLLTQISVEDVSKSFSDHNLIITNIANNENYKEPPFKKQNSHMLSNFQFWSDEIKWEEMNKYFNDINWEEKLKSENKVEDDTNTLYNEIYNACIKYIPKKNNKKPYRIPRDRRKLMRRKKFLKRSIKNKTNQKEKDKISEKITNIDTKLLKSHENEQLRKEHFVVKDIKKNSKLFFSYAKKCAKKVQCIGPLKDEKGKITKDPKEMSDILRNQYEKAFNKSKNDIDISLDKPTKGSTINLNDFFSHDGAFSDLEISHEDIINMIKETKRNTAPGADCLPSILLHQCATSLVNPLYKILNKSLKNGDIPQMWKEALITPIHKGGDKQDPSEYRPISLTILIVKILERIIRSYLIQYLEVNDAFPDSQHGFRTGRSTVSQLIEQYDAILDALGSQSNIDIIMLDYSKAFDKINQTILLVKLKNLGITGNIGRWIGNFILERTQYVSINGHMSDPSKVISGVPQGTILAPLLFLIYISDMGNTITKSTLSSYADDSKIYKIIKTKEDGRELQNDATKIYKWTHENLMKFNTTKFAMLRIGNNQQLKDEIKYTTPEGKVIPETTVIKDLGVYFNNKGDFTDHVKIKCAKAKQISGYIFRTFKTRNVNIMMTLFKSLVLPVIDYGSIVWSPYTQKLKSTLESVQRYFTSKIEGMEDLDYYQRLKNLKLLSVERRHERYTILYIFKILQSKVPNPGICHKWSPRRGRILITPTLKSSKTSHANTLIHHSFRHRAPRLFNILPQHIRNMSDQKPLEIIKKKIDEFLAKVADEPRLSGYHPTNCSTSNRLDDQVMAKAVLFEDDR